jgi:acetyl-CoA acetyltransferase/uncharacterized OB-fold protein
MTSPAPSEGRRISMEGAARPLPVVDETNAFYWTAGADGVLRFQQCQSCQALLHPPQPLCRYCRSEDLGVTEVEGTGTVIGVSVNHQRWTPEFEPPYVVASVAIDDDPRVHVLTNLVDVDPEDVEVGQRVRVHFEKHDDVYLPLFSPVTDGLRNAAVLPEDEIAPGDHAKHVRPMVRADKFEDRVVISGIGASPIGRRLMVPPLSLTVAAVKAAVADAGLELSDLDGLSTYPGMDVMGGFSEGGISALEDALGIQPTWYNGAFETFGPGGSVVAAMLAVAGGLARHVLCFRTVWQATFAAQQRSLDPSAGSPYAIGGGAARVPGFVGPYGLSSASINLGLIASHYLKRYGASRETLGWIALNGRANAAKNPEAIYRDPMTMDDYLGARLISTPFGLYDCDVPADASIAVIVSAAETAGDLASTPVFVEAVGTQVTERWAWDQSTMTHEPQTLGPAAHLWSRTSLRPDDVQVAELYDGFTFNCLSWLEGLGFCGIGEAKDFLDGGANVAPGGVVALNTHGGQLSAGRTHGMGFIHEAVTQLRGTAGARQVDGARVAVASTGGLAPSGALLLRGS